MNASKIKTEVTSKYKGVYFNKRNGKFSAYIQKNRRRLFLGNYEKEEDAAYYYNEREKELHGEFAVLNVLPEDYEPTVPFAPNMIIEQYSKYRGVTYSKRDKRYIAAIHNKGKRFHIGSFMTDRIAAEMYNVAAIEIHKENAILNVFYD
ncbi:AP2 domain-containing protein [Bacillus toyonensis]|uniref:AP2 domain-containing protein n=1 Tax=Bacillus toyonensis TaxID=155322 RepID=UPI00211D96FF|nr:AP2 domain-containing protein [Bacillus toyonensis]